MDTEAGDWRAVQSLPAPPNCATQLGRYELDADAYFRQVQLCLATALHAEPSVSALVLTTQMHGFVLTDTAMRVRSHYVSWQDRASLTRGSDGMTAMEALQRLLPSDALAGHGVPLKPNLALCNLYARIREGLAIEPDTLLHTLGGYMLARLGGPHLCHDTNAAPLGVYNVAQQIMNSDLSHAILGRSIILPEAVSSFEPVAKCVIEGHTMSLYPDVGDHQACVLGALEGQPNRLCVNVGTAGLMNMVAAAFTYGPYETRPFFGGSFLPTVSGLPGGRHLDVLFQFVRRFLDRFGATVPDDAIWSSLMYCDANPTLTIRGDIFTGGGDISGIGPTVSLDDVIASTYLAIGKAYAQAARVIKPVDGSYSMNVVFLGGAAEKNAALRRHIQQQLGMPHASVSRDSVLLGALELARSIER
jgi:sugar (pentulose or hexulose) kinase